MKLDIIYTYYNGQDILEDYLYNWSNNFKDTKHDINFIIVDDHSEKKLLTLYLSLMYSVIYRFIMLKMILYGTRVVLVI